MDGRMVVEVFGRGTARYVKYYPKSLIFIITHPMSLTAELAAAYCIELIINRLMMMVSSFTLPSAMPRLCMK